MITLEKVLKTVNPSTFIINDYREVLSPLVYRAGKQPPDTFNLLEISDDDYTEEEKKRNLQ